MRVLKVTHLCKDEQRIRNDSMELEQSHLAYGMYDRLYLQEKGADAEMIQTPEQIKLRDPPQTTARTSSSSAGAC